MNELTPAFFRQSTSEILLTRAWRGPIQSLDRRRAASIRFLANAFLRICWPSLSTARRDANQATFWACAICVDIQHAAHDTPFSSAEIRTIMVG